MGVLIGFLCAVYVIQVILTTFALLDNDFKSKKEYFIANIPFFILIPIMMFRKIKALPSKPLPRPTLQRYDLD